MAEPCLAIPQGCRDHVYIFFVNGLDPLNKDNLNGLRDYVNRLGFNQTYYCQLYHYWWVEKEIHRLAQTDPEAHFVLVGFSFGTNEVCSITRHLQAHQIPIDLLIYLGGDTLHNVPKDRPANARRIINITARGCNLLFLGLIWDGVDLDGATNVRVTEVGHSSLPTYRQTVELLSRSLAEVASAVPVATPLSPPVMPAALLTAPTPRPVPPPASVRRDEWDFLKPPSPGSSPAVYTAPPGEAPAMGPLAGNR